MFLLAACGISGAPVPTRVAERGGGRRPIVLEASQAAPGAPLQLRAVGGWPGAPISVVYGIPGGQSCDPAQPALCVDLGGAALLRTATADSAGNARWTVKIPLGVPVGLTRGLQAVAREPGTAAWSVSNVVERTLTDRAAIVDPPGGNVLILLADDVGVDKVGAYGLDPAAQTPNIDALATGGMRFENAWAYASCAPTRAAVQTGRHARRTGYGANQSAVASPNELDPAELTLAELVDYSPSFIYSSSYVGKWHLSSESSASGTLGPRVQGWDWFSGSLGNISDGSDLLIGEPSYFNWRKVDNAGNVAVNHRYATTDQVDDAVARIAAMPEPWVLQVAFFAAHDPLTLPPAALRGDLDLTVYIPVPQRAESVVTAMDTEIGRLLAALSPDQRARTNILFLGDNGTAAKATELVDQPARSKNSEYDGGVRVPFIVNGPVVGAAGSTSGSLVEAVDIFPTLAAIAGVDTAVLPGVLDPDLPLALDGVSLLPTLADPAAPAHAALYSDVFVPAGPGPFLYDRRTMRDSRYKLVYDAILEQEQFFEYLPGARNEGPDLLLCGLSPEQDAARLALRAQMDGQIAAMPFDSHSFGSLHADTGKGDTAGADTGSAIVTMPLDTGLPDCTPVDSGAPGVDSGAPGVETGGGTAETGVVLPDTGISPGGTGVAGG